ncbi:MAG: hypothetical protein P8X55_08770 [Desulfosarcinaceae bacterium]
MIGNQRPGQAWGLALIDDHAEAFYKKIPVGIIIEHFVARNAPGDNMMQCPWGTYAAFACHGADATIGTKLRQLVF